MLQHVKIFFIMCGMEEEIKQSSVKKPMSEARKRANAKYKKANCQYITFMAKKGSRDRIVQAAAIKGVSVNGFIREAVDKAVEDTTGLSMEGARNGEE